MEEKLNISTFQLIRKLLFGIFGLCAASLLLILLKGYDIDIAYVILLCVVFGVDTAYFHIIVLYRMKILSEYNKVSLPSELVKLMNDYPISQKITSVNKRLFNLISIAGLVNNVIKPKDISLLKSWVLFLKKAELDWYFYGEVLKPVKDYEKERMYESIDILVPNSNVAKEVKGVISYLKMGNKSRNKETFPPFFKHIEEIEEINGGYGEIILSTRVRIVDGPTKINLCFEA